MRLRMLGPVRFWDGAAWAPVAAEQQRRVLAALLVEAGQVVSTQRLIDQVWGGLPPGTARKTIHAYVMRLRRHLGGDLARALVTRGPGYELILDEGDLDAWEFERLAAAGQRALATGEAEQAMAQLSAALALWQGPVLADVPAGGSRSDRVAQLERARLAVLEDRTTALLTLGAHQQAVHELDRLVREHPLRERLWANLMLALHQSGRRADALGAYQRARQVLVAEAGLEPGPRLRELQDSILAEDVVAVPPGRAVTAVPLVGPPAQLPADVAGFTGRGDLLNQLDATLPTVGDPAPAVLVALSGTAGAGKTALAVRWGHRVRGRFGDGQLYVDLCGYADRPPVRPAQALAWFLRALGVPAGQVPPTPEEAGGLYRSLLADKRVLVVLDNARDPEQVRPLLPAGPGCLAVVASRDRLDGLAARDGAVPLHVGPLTDDEAHRLIRTLLRARVDAEPAAVGELIRLCGHLPLALRIAATHLSVPGHAGIGEYVAGLRQDQLGGLEVADDPRAGVRAAFDLSYAVLPEPARRLFRTLGLVADPDVSVPAAAVSAGIDPAATTKLLRRLVAASLADEHLPGRYRLPGLLRVFAAEQAGQPDLPAGTGQPGPEPQAARHRRPYHPVGVRPPVATAAPGPGQ